MNSRDFLHKYAETPFYECFVAAGATCGLSTNCESILEAARESFVPVDTHPSRVDFTFHFWVDPTGRNQPPWPKVYCRGLDHLMFAGFDTGSFALIDLHTPRAIGRFSPAMGADCAYLRKVIFPVLLSIVAQKAD